MGHAAVSVWWSGQREGRVLTRCFETDFSHIVHEGNWQKVMDKP